MTVKERLLDAARESGARAFDPQTFLTCGSSRETIWWTMTFLESRKAEDVAFANRVLEHLPVTSESGHSMAPLGFIYYHYADLLTPEARRHIERKFEFAVPGLAHSQYHYGNVNHPLTGFAGVVFAGDILKQPALSAYGHALLEEFLWKIDWQKDDDRAMSALSEYNSPTYTATDIFGIHCAAAHAQNPATRDLARKIEEKFWLDLALFYHHPTSSLCGPHSRSYQEGCFGAGTLIDGFVWKAGGGSTFLDFDLLDYCHHSADRILWATAGVFECFLTEQAREILFHKRFPYEVHANAFCGEWQDGQTVIADSETRYTRTGESYPGDYQHLSSYQTANACLACADRMFADGGHNNSFMLRWRRTERVEKRADIRTIYTRYLVDDQLYGTTYKLGALDDRDWDGMLRIMDNGRAHILHHRQKAIVLYCAKRREWEGRTRLRLGIHITEFSPLEGLWLEEERLERYPVDFDWRRTVYVEDGSVFVAIRALEPVDYGRRTPCRIERIKDHLLFSIYNYEGPRASWDRDTMQMMHNGFVVEYGEREEYGTLERFRAHIGAGRVKEEVVSYGIREVSYESGGDRLHVRYDALREKILTATANGRSSVPRYLDVTMEGRHDPEFCPTRIW